VGPVGGRVPAVVAAAAAAVAPNDPAPWCQKMEVGFALGALPINIMAQLHDDPISQVCLGLV
jgi:hypothetical protein